MDWFPAVVWPHQVPCCTALMFASYSWLNPEKSITAAQAFTAIALLNMVQEMVAGGSSKVDISYISYISIR
jgi:hypothetical protein